MGPSILSGTRFPTRLHQEERNCAQHRQTNDEKSPENPCYFADVRIAQTNKRNQSRYQEDNDPRNEEQCSKHI